MRNVFFGPFRLEISPHPHDPNETLLRLFRAGQFQSVERLQLRLLRFLADDNPGKELTVDEIAAAIWPTKTGGDNVQKQISLLRTKVLGDETRPHKYIETIRDNAAYKFIARVHAEGELERLYGFQKWSTPRLIERLEKLCRNDNEPEDLRIVTSGLVPSRHDLDVEDYLRRRHIRIRIVMMNPENTSLLKSRYDLRAPDYTFEEAQRDIRNQIKYLRRIMSRFSHEALQVHLSDAIPSLIVHTPQWALLGIFPARGSYVLGPMVEVDAGTSLWETLYDEWKIRWDSPAERIAPDSPV